MHAGGEGRGGRDEEPGERHGRRGKIVVQGTRAERYLPGRIILPVRMSCGQGGLSAQERMRRGTQAGGATLFPGRTWPP